MKYIKTFFNKIPIVRQKSDVVVIEGGKKIYNPSEELLKKHGWELYSTQEEVVEEYRKKKIKDIQRYDTSHAINGFTVNGVKMWLDKATRVGLMLRLQSEQQAGYSNTTLWYDNVEYVLPIEMAIQMLHNIEIYASKCYDTTQKHIATVMALDNVQDIKQYNYSAGYPEQLSFNTELDS